MSRRALLSAVGAVLVLSLAAVPAARPPTYTPPSGRVYTSGAAGG